MNPSSSLSRPPGSSATTSVTVSSTVRPRNKRVVSTRDEDLLLGYNENGNGTAGTRLISPITSPASSRAASPIPSRHPSRSVSKGAGNALVTSTNGRPLGGMSLEGTQTPVAFASGLWENSWSALQGIASTVLGSDAVDSQKGKSVASRRQQQLRRKPSDNYVTPHRRTVSAALHRLPPTEWGPSGDAAKKGITVGGGSKESREALVRAKRREDLLSNGAGVLDASGRYKHRKSDELGRPTSSSAPPTDRAREEADTDTLVYIHHVRPTDTVAGVAIQFNCAMSAFRRANRLWPNDPIQSRKAVVLPVDACGVKGRPIPAPTVDLLSGDDFHTTGQEISSASNHISLDSPSLPPTSSPYSKTSKRPSTPPDHDHQQQHEEPPWKHESWVAIDGIPHSVEIARLPRKALGFFPPSRRKSVTFSDLDTPPTSIDLPRSIMDSGSSPPPTTSQPAAGGRRSRSGSYFGKHPLTGPGGVGTLDPNVRAPGPAQDGLNKYIATHMPSVLPRGSMDSASSATSGLENVGSAIEGWMRKLASRAVKVVEGAGVASSPRVGPVMGDLIELTAGMDGGEDEGFLASLVEEESRGGSTARQQGVDGQLRDRRRGGKE